MMNVLVLEGYLGRDIEMRIGAGGSSYGVVSLCNSMYMGKNADNSAKFADTWLDCHFDGALAEALQERLTKGRFVSFKGELRSFQTEDGKSRGLPPRIYMKVDGYSFPPQAQRGDGRGSSASAPTPTPAIAAPAAQRAAPAPAPAAAPRAPAKTTQVGAGFDDDDDYAFQQR
jgi:single-stranded DNA-binding protein